MVKNLHANSGDLGLIPGSGRSPGGGLTTPRMFLHGKFHGQGSLGRLQSLGLQRVGYD